ncbi:MAG TPA: twin-arginine translocase TatA/TatE family subunit [Victivallales bacterium]|nr:twin-arginine translocase TatA/TatE family subunit [Victivallales bacterium]HPO90196.1 twin-arginine translocase TatA/TatE family subunit [Victivallales bacterium]HRR06673.1 twin-arginine translocase TatA/TatE family subunit [Victivallales bacterium]HRR27735.1 twin-arginine translocase TatA/TatE family subunit [Victivallales bacterium]HRU00264.1 twin-arginine translocase TatA/TatE family subunit [Victivallales bacterium]
MFGLGTGEIIIIFIVILLLFGGRKIPEVARGLGKGIREFKKAKEGFEESLNEAIEEKEEKKSDEKK